MKNAGWLAAVMMAGINLAFASELPQEAAQPSPEVMKLLSQGFLLVSGNDPTGAVVAFRKALALDTGNRSAKYGISTAYIKMERYKESVVILDSLIQQFPDDFALKNNAAWLYATATEPRFRDPAKAVDLARQALLLAPRDYHVWSTLSEAHYSAGEYEKALRSAREAEKLAISQKAAAGEIETYTKQCERCENAAAAFRIWE